MLTHRAARSQAGFTLVEIMIVVLILAVVAGITLPQYRSAVQTARFRKAETELMTIARAIDGYSAQNGGNFPLTLHQVGFGGKRDPWGVPYCYFNYQDGTGDGLEWAIEAGIVDPSAVGGGTPVATPSPTPAATPPSGGSPSARAPRNPGGASGQGSPLSQTTSGTGVAAIASRGHAPIVAAENSRSLAEAVNAKTGRSLSTQELQSLRESLEQAGNPMIFSGIDEATVRRRDRFLYPVNSDYDLFSLGPNGRTAVSLGQPLAQDDVLRANNGGFYGVASSY